MQLLQSLATSQGAGSLKLALVTEHGKYVCAGLNGHAVGDRDHASDWETFEFQKAGPGIFYIRTHRGKFACCEGNGNFVMNRDNPSGWEQFAVEFRSNGKIAIKSVAHNTYLSAQQDGRLECNRPQAQAWEEFKVVARGDALVMIAQGLSNSSIMVTLRSTHGKYVSMEQNGNAVANRDAAQGWEEVRIDGIGNGVVTLKSAHGKFACCEGNGNFVVNRDAADGWEHFRLLLVAPGKIAIQSVAHNTFLSAQPDGRLECNRQQAQDWEFFDYNVVGSMPMQPTPVPMQPLVTPQPVQTVIQTPGLIPHHEYQALLQRIKNETFSSMKMKVLEENKGTHNYLVDQIIEILSLFTFSSEKVSLVSVTLSQPTNVFYTFPVSSAQDP
ncbi:MAG: hypothetical protein MHM6MM_007215 [Cercozoa sp. M6MM]